ncbi:RNA polymerase sigma factor [Phenylobacterium aquaticum]|uniref:RNA polymerase sigma factor n=1 Tax=Phenylobacterium aquaticum TaxID=1763816 RepID=UPI001F5CF302|nr:RNA polymerase sigma factor [Phenylobacterium aquaticum]MCI3135339.1 RNA polymerase sigma factor [Phenylobacterium aquaticum]
MGQRDDVEDGGSRGLGALYRTYADWLLRRLKLRFGSEAAEDLAQETYLRLARSGPQAEVLVHPKAYLMRVAVNLAQDQALYEHRHVRGAALAQESLGQATQVEVASQVETLVLKDIILSMPKPYRAVFLLARMEGMTYDEIGQTLGLSVKTVEWRMARALRHCSQQLRPYR